MIDLAVIDFGRCMGIQFAPVRVILVFSQTSLYNATSFIIDVAGMILTTSSATSIKTALTISVGGLLCKWLWVELVLIASAAASMG